MELQNIIDKFRFYFIIIIYDAMLVLLPSSSISISWWCVPERELEPVVLFHVDGFFYLFIAAACWSRFFIFVILLLITVILYIYRYYYSTTTTSTVLYFAVVDEDLVCCLACLFFLVAFALFVESGWSYIWQSIPSQSSRLSSCVYSLSKLSINFMII